MKNSPPAPVKIEVKTLYSCIVSSASKTHFYFSVPWIANQVRVLSPPPPHNCQGGGTQTDEQIKKCKQLNKHCPIITMIMQTKTSPYQRCKVCSAVSCNGIQCQDLIKYHLMSCIVIYCHEIMKYHLVLFSVISCHIV